MQSSSSDDKEKKDGDKDQGTVEFESAKRNVI